MLTKESINRKEFLMKMGFSGASLMVILSSCMNSERIVTPTTPNAPTVSASTVTNSPITITTESAGTIIVFNGTTQLATLTAVAGANTYIPTTEGTYTFKLQTTVGTSEASETVIVTTKIAATPSAPTVSTSAVNTNSPITITTTAAGTIIVFNGSTQVTTITGVIGANTYTPTTVGTYTFKLQTSAGTSGASTAVTVTAVSTTNDLLTLDLTASANSALKTVGGYIQKSNIVVALVAANTYAAVTQTCSHEGQKQVYYDGTEFYCPVHGAKYSIKGVGLNANGSNGLTVYKTSLAGNILHVYA